MQNFIAIQENPFFWDFSTVLNHSSPFYCSTGARGVKAYLGGGQDKKSWKKSGKIEKVKKSIFFQVCRISLRFRKPHFFQIFRPS